MFDNKGRKLWCHWVGDPVDDLVLLNHGNHIARMQIIWEENCITLCDIFVAHPRFRNSGIGKWMFIHLIDLAKQKNISRIVGRMQPETKDKWPELIKFYTKLGCEIDGNHFLYYIE
ncbi:MAG: GNAT family N-acetyltransferase [Anaerolineaceae bacterium]|nr:GNAT family N-acetyltransferase [Anaerolineaceae bacterium]